MKHLICRAHTKEHIWTVHILNLANLTAQLDLSDNETYGRTILRRFFYTVIIARENILM